MSFSANQLQQIWQKGNSVQGYDPAKYRQDQCGAWIQWEEYGNESTTLGWQVDHIQSVARGGSDDISNLQPLQHENNKAKGDGPLRCVVKSNGNKNVRVA